MNPKQLLDYTLCKKRFNAFFGFFQPIKDTSIPISFSPLPFSSYFAAGKLLKIRVSIRNHNSHTETYHFFSVFIAVFGAGNVDKKIDPER
jgi:hypothetical protein